jgi:hypothetical protein
MIKSNMKNKILKNIKEMYRKRRHPPKDDISPSTCSGPFSTSPFSDFTFPLGWGVTGSIKNYNINN